MSATRSRYDVVVGDRLAKLRVTIKDNETDAPVDLTGKTATLRYSINNGSLETRSMIVLDQGTSLGQAQYQFMTGDIASAGEMRGEVRLQDSLPDQVTTVDQFFLRIRNPMS